MSPCAHPNAHLIGLSAYQIVFYTVQRVLNRWASANAPGHSRNCCSPASVCRIRCVFQLLCNCFVILIAL